MGEHLGLRYLTHKQHMAAQILLGKHLAGEHSVGILRQVHKTIMASCGLISTAEFVGIPTGLHSKVANGLKGDTFCQHADIENAGIFNHLPGQVSFLDGNDQLCGIICYLETGVGNAAVIFVRFPGAEYKQSVGQVEQRLGIFRRYLLLSESSAPADPSEPCRGEPRHEPFRERCRGSHPSRFS